MTIAWRQLNGQTAARFSPCTSQSAIPSSALILVAFSLGDVLARGSWIDIYIRYIHIRLYVVPSIAAGRTNLAQTSRNPINRVPPSWRLQAKQAKSAPTTGLITAPDETRTTRVPASLGSSVSGINVIVTAVCQDSQSFQALLGSQSPSHRQKSHRHAPRTTAEEVDDRQPGPPSGRWPIMLASKLWNIPKACLRIEIEPQSIDLVLEDGCFRPIDPLGLRSPAISITFFTSSQQMLIKLPACPTIGPARPRC